MKRILSLILCITLVLSMNLNIITADAAGSGAMLAKYNCIVNMKGVEDFEAVYGNYSYTAAISVNGVKQGWLYLGKNSPTNTPSFTLTKDTETFEGNTVMKMYYNGAYAQIQPNGTVPSGLSTTAARIDADKVVYEGKVYNETDATPKWKFYPEANTEYTIGGTLFANTWYHYTITINMGSNIEIRYTQILEEGEDFEPHVVGRTINLAQVYHSYVRYFPGVAAGTTTYWDDFRVYTDEPETMEKPELISVGSDGEVAFEQNKVSFKLTHPIEGLTKEHVKISDVRGNEFAVDELVIPSDGDQTEVTAILSSNLPAWTDYTLTIDKACYGDGVDELDSVGNPVELTSPEMIFYTPSAPYDMQSPTFTVDSMIYAESMVVNRTGNPENLTLVMAGFDKNGRPVSTEAISHSNFEAQHPGAPVSISASAQGCDYFKFFVINDWGAKLPVFGKTWIIASDGSSMSDFPATAGDVVPGDAAKLVLGDFPYENIANKFDHKNKKISLNIDTKSADFSNGTLCIYKDGTVPSDSSLPVYVDNLATASDGTCKKEIYLPKDIAYGKYIVEFSYPGDVLTEEFEYKTADELKADRKDGMVNAALAATSHTELNLIILGIDENGNKVNSNFNLVSSDADMTDYDKVENKEKVIVKMIDKISTATSFDKLVELFEECAKQQLKDENTTVNSPSSDNKNYGDTSTSIKETVSSGSSGGFGGSSGGFGTGAVGGGSVATTPSVPSVNVNAPKFSDIGGHWALNYINEMNRRGIMNGYGDGSFKAENSITRAELIKTLVEAFKVSASGNASYKDVDANAWYTSYIQSATAAGIINGFEDGTFAPENAVTRQDAALMIFRTLSIGRTLPIGYTFFSDDLEIDLYASGATRTLGELGILTGDSSKAFNPKKSITRAEVATIICRAIDYIESH